MTHNYTENNIIRFVYKECDLFEKLEMEFAMEEDSTLLEEYNTMMVSYCTLPKVLFSPKKSTLDAILAYSASSNA